jgi:peptidoglycan-N-acetylglucosamine deacetylase
MHKLSGVQRASARRCLACGWWLSVAALLIQAGSSHAFASTATTHPMSQTSHPPKSMGQHVNLSRMFPGVVYYHGPASQKQVALTFDDGPDMRYTPQILDILKKYHVKATFFVLGFRAKAHPDMVRRMVREGHTIGNHSWNHLDQVRLSPDKVRDQVVRADKVLYPLVGYHPDLVRPPYGKADPDTVRIISGMGYKVIDWSVDTRDWAGTPVPAILSLVRKEVRPGGIILEHCAGNANVDLSNTVQALPQVIQYLRAQGYQLVTVPQLFGTER